MTHNNYYDIFKDEYNIFTQNLNIKLRTGEVMRGGYESTGKLLVMGNTERHSRKYAYKIYNAV